MSAQPPSTDSGGAHKVPLRFETFRDFLDAYSSRISQEGMFIETESPLPVGSLVEFDVRLSDEFRLLEGTGEVIWTIDPGTGADWAPGMAVRFKQLDEPGRRLAARLVQNHINSGGTPFSLAALPPPGGGTDTAARPVDLAVEPPPEPPALDPGPPLPEAGRPAPDAARPEPPAAAPPTGPSADEEEAAETAPPAPPASPTGPPGQPRLDFEALPVESILGPAPPAESAEADLPGAATDEPPPAPAAGPEAGGAEAGELLRVPDLPELAAAPPPPIAAEGESPPPPTPAEPPAPIQPPEPVEAPAAAEIDGPAGPEEAAAPEEAAPPPSASPPAFPPAEAPTPPIPAAETEAPRPAGAPPAPLEPPSAAPSEDEVELTPLPYPIAGSASVSSPVRYLRWLPLLLLLLGAAAAVGYYLAGPRIAAWLGREAGESAVEAGEAVEETSRPAAESPEPAGPPPAAVEEPAPPAAAEAAPAGEPSPVESPAPPPVPELPPMTSVREVSWERDGADTLLVLTADGSIETSRIESARLAGGAPRLLIKVRGVGDPYPVSSLAVGSRQVRQVRFGFHPEVSPPELHLVADLTSPSVQILAPRIDGNTVRFRFTGG